MHDDPHSSPSSALAARLAGWKEAFLRHGFTAFFLAVTIVVTRAENATFALTDFTPRIVSTPTVDGIDIVARTRLFVTSVLLFAILFPVLLAVLRGLRRIAEESVFPILEALSIAGTSLWIARAFTMHVGGALDLVLAMSGALAVAAILDRWVFRRGAHVSPAAYAVLLGIAAFGCVLVESDFGDRPEADEPVWSPLRVFRAACLLHLSLRVLSIRADRARGERAFALWAPCLLAFAWLPIVSVLRTEFYLILNNNGWTAIVPDAIQQVLLASLAIAMVIAAVRRFRADRIVDLEQRAVSFAMPLFVFGLGAVAWYYPQHELPRDLFEPANPTLFVQQFFDFGRIPFLETFNAHGLADSFWSFVYRFLHGGSDEVFGMYEFLNRALAAALIYAVLRRITGNAYLAFFIVAFSPFRVAMFPVYCELALTSYFVLSWFLARPNLKRVVALAFYCVFVFLWRLDIGAANLVAVAVTLGLHWFTGASTRPRWRDLVFGGAICGAACAIPLLTLAAWRDVSVPPLLLRLSHIVDSSQGFGIAVAPVVDSIVSFHLAVFPLVVLAVLAGVVVLWIARPDRARAKAPIVLFLCFAGAYYFANYQRGLVRHTFSEPGNVYLLSFGFATLAAATLLAPWRNETTKALGFLGAAAFLAGCFGLEGPDPVRVGGHEAVYERAERHRRTHFHLAHVPWRIDRTPTSPFLEQHHYGAVREFVSESLAPEQTFLDLTNSPMLYAITHRRSPHYLNHLYLAHDEWLQKDAAQEFRRHDIPVVFAWMDRELAARDRVESNRHNFGDTVLNNVRHWFLHEWLHRHYEPWRTVQRWETWRRKDWLSPVAPEGIGSRDRTAGERAPRGGFSFRRVDESDPPLTTGRDRIPYLRIDRSATESVRIVVRLAFSDGAAGDAETKRELTIPAGEGPLHWTLPIDSAWRAIAAIHVDDASGFVRSVTYCDVIATEYTRMPDLLAETFCPNLGMAAWLWAHFDAKGAISRPVLRHLEVPPGWTPGSPEPRRGDTRMFFGPLEQPFDPCYVKLRLNRTDPNLTNVGIVWGRDDVSISRINFDLGGDGPQEYLIRVSSQYSWSSGRCNWIQVVLPETGVTIETAAILKGD